MFQGFCQSSSRVLDLAAPMDTHILGMARTHVCSRANVSHRAGVS